MPTDTTKAVVINPPGQLLSVDICVIGAGAGGLAVATAAAAFGQRVVLIEKHKMGGQSLSYGCIPSKALVVAGKRAQAMRTSAKFGIAAVEPQIDARGVHDHVKCVISAIAPNTSVERFTGMGIRVITAAGKFVDKSTVVAGDYRVTARRFVIATGSSPAVPLIPGLADLPYFTNETIFENSARLAHLIIVGGEPSGLELAQAYRRLGSEVTVLDGGKALSSYDSELTGFVLARLRNEGVVIREGVAVQGVSGAGGSVAVTVKHDDKLEVIAGSHVLVATGRKPNVADLGLDAAGIAYEKTGITVNAGLHTTNKRVFAIGDVIGGSQFAHVANDHAGIVLRRALFRMPAKATRRVIAKVTFTDPEIAHVGLSETQARAKYRKVNVLRWPYHENDRAQVERETVGNIKVVVSPRGHIIGATIVGAQAAELIQMWSLALSQGLKIKAMTEWISPYPTLSEINKRAAFRYYATAAGNPVVRKVIAWLAKLG
ncbi:MAG TPA: FAD-dependent oxidoreductase [Hyphomicrobium sp.]|nr:FAD-dependent oxidoreductase [Hyphomicrobium sp.]